MAICKERHPAVWKGASGVVIRKPGKANYMKLKASSSISRLSCMGNGVEKVVAELLSEDCERRGLLRESQFRSTKRWSAIIAVAIMVYRAHATWTNGQITGMLLMGIKAAFPAMGKLRKTGQSNESHADGWRP